MPMKKDTIKKSAKTGQIVSDEFAEANPETTFETKVTKKAKANVDVDNLVAEIALFNANVNPNAIDRQKLIARCEAIAPQLVETVEQSFL